MTTKTLPLQADAARDLARVDRMARLLDSRFRLFGIRFGLDGILGLIPGLGDLVTVGPAAWMLYTAWKHGVGTPTLARMGMNSGLDLLVGGIPILGDIFDIAFKANLRNADLLRDALTRNHTPATIRD